MAEQILFDRLIYVDRLRAAGIGEEQARAQAEALHAALQEAENQQVTGRELTPFLLSRMAQVSEGATLKANIALLENNARIAAQISGTLTD